MPDHDLPAFTETFSDARDGAGIALTLAQMEAGSRSGPVLWVQDRLALREGGLPYGPGLRGEFGLKGPILRVTARDAAAALWAMEEGLECAALSAVIGEIRGNPKALDFTATKRLALRARRTGVPVWLLRQDAQADLSVAPDRWRAASAASTGNPLDMNAPGAALWEAELFRSRRRAPGLWVAGHDRAAHRLDLAAPLRDGAMGAGGEPASGSRPAALGGRRA